MIPPIRNFAQLQAQLNAAFGGAFLSALDYGVKGDGGADDTVALQAALDAAGAVGRLVALPGMCRTKTLSIPSNTGFVGLGPNCGVDIIDDGTLTGHSLYLNGASDVVFDGIAVNCSNVSGRTGVYGNIRMESATRVFVRGCRFYQSPSTAVWAQNSSQIVFQGNHVRSTKADGVHFSRASHDIAVIGNTFDNCGDDNIAFVGYTGPSGEYDPMYNCAAVGNVIRDNVISGSGVVFLGVIDGVASGNTIRNTILHGIAVAGNLGLDTQSTHFCYNIAISGNAISNPSAGGSGRAIILQNCRAISAQGNVCDQGAEDAMIVSGVGIDITVTGNRFSRGTLRGINVDQIPSTDARLISELYTAWGDTAPGAALCARISIIGNRVEKQGLEAIHVQGASGQLIDGVVIANNDVDARSDTTRDGVLVSYASGVQITGNRLRTKGTPTATSGMGIRCAGTHDAVVSGNSCVAVGETGIGLVGAGRTQVTGNLCNDNFNYGIYEDPTSTNNVAGANMVKGNGAGPVQVSTAITFNNN